MRSRFNAISPFLFKLGSSLDVMLSPPRYPFTLNELLITVLSIKSDISFGIFLKRLINSYQIPVFCLVYLPIFVLSICIVDTIITICSPQFDCCISRSLAVSEGLQTI